MSSGTKFNKRVLVAPLDWGLGHATRSIAVIRELLAYGADVWVATSGMQRVVLEESFPQLHFLELPGYGVRYGRRGVMLRLLAQIPAIRRHIFTEHAWLQQAIADYGFAGVISDNRYGLYSRDARCVLITHQLALQLPRWASFTRAGVQQMLYHHIEHFDACWIPDAAVPNEALAGAMSHPHSLPQLPIAYIGWLSRFQAPEKFPERNTEILVSISGPEPQRKIFETLVLEQARDISHTIHLVRGLPGTSLLPASPPRVRIYNHLPTHAMAHLMLHCGLLICRSGYSTLMDALVLQTPMHCVPTPGQTEQEYLAKRLQSLQYATISAQEHFSLTRAINAPRLLPPQSAIQDNLLGHAVGQWLQSL